MAFTSTILERAKSIGHMRMSFGSFNAYATTGGDINTGLNKCHMMMLTHKGTGVEASVAVVNETMPCTGTAVTIVCNASDQGYWLAYGY